jgi:hypothetical protein
MSNLDLKSSTITDFLIKNKDNIEATVLRNTLNMNGEVELLLKPNNLKFKIRESQGSGGKLVYYCQIDKNIPKAVQNCGTFFEMEEKDYRRIEEEFLYTNKDLDLELKSLIRGGKLDDVLKDDVT